MFVALSQILADEVEAELKEASVISMGTEVSDLDLIHIRELCDQVLSLAEYRAQLYDYLKSRMNTIAPNLTALVGELVGARLISHGGSLLNLAKQPGSTVQILGAEKALFRALKTKHNTPKYGLIFHASVVGQAGRKNKPRIARSLAAKAALSIRCDALGDAGDNSMGVENRLKLEARLRSLEGRDLGRLAGSAKGKPKIEVYNKDKKMGSGGLIAPAEVRLLSDLFVSSTFSFVCLIVSYLNCCFVQTYNTAADSLLVQTTVSAENGVKEKKDKKKKKKAEAEEEEEAKAEESSKKKKKKKAKTEVEPEVVEPAKKEKKKKRKHEEEETEEPAKKKEERKEGEEEEEE